MLQHRMLKIEELQEKPGHQAHLETVKNPKILIPSDQIESLKFAFVKLVVF